jgi:hypothetical protein
MSISNCRESRKAPRRTRPSAPPPIPETERALLGSILVTPNEASEAMSEVLKEIPLDRCILAHPPHRVIFETMLELWREKGTVDSALLCERLHTEGRLEDAGGASYISELMGVVPTSANARHYAREVREAADRREAAEALDRAATRLAQGDDPLELLEELRCVETAQPAFREAPIPLSEDYGPPWPDDALPSPLGEFVDALTAFAEIPRDMAALCALATCAAACRKRFSVLVKPGHFQPLNLWVSIHLPPSTRKTGTLEACRGPFLQWERDQVECLAPEIARNQSLRKTVIARIKGLRRKAASAKSDAAADSLQEEIFRLEATMPPEMFAPRLWVSDTTTEALGRLLHQNDGCLMQASSEAGIFGILAGRYNRNSAVDLDLYNESYTGAGTYRYERVTREPLIIPHPSLTLLLCTQDDVLHALNETPEFRGRGLLGRFIWCKPRHGLGRRSDQGPPIPDTVYDAYGELIYALLNQPEHIKDGRAVPRVIKLSPEAAALRHDFWKELESLIADGAAMQSMRDWVGKFQDGFVRIAAVLHAVQFAHEDPAEHRLSKDTMRRAIATGRWAIEHAKVCYGCMNANPALADARELRGWIRRQGKPVFNRREAHRALQHHFATAEALEPALKMLCAHHFIRPLSAERANGIPGRPASERYMVHPEMQNQNPQKY